MTKRTKRSKAFVKQIYADLGSYVSGKLPDRHGIHRVYWGVFANFLFGQIHQSYVRRSTGRTDNLGNRFAPLAKSTRRRKKQKLKKRRSTSSLKPSPKFDVLIMRDTDTLLKSLEPSKAGERGYRPRRNQTFEVINGKAKFGTKVEYAEYHKFSRPVLPDNMQPWIDKAHEKAMKAALKHIETKVL